MTPAAKEAMRAEAVGRVLRAVLDLVESGELRATAAQRRAIECAVDALDALDLGHLVLDGSAAGGCVLRIPPH